MLLFGSLRSAKLAHAAMRHISVSVVAAARNTAAHIPPRRIAGCLPVQPRQLGTVHGHFSTRVYIPVKLPGRYRAETVGVAGSLVSHAKKAVMAKFQRRFKGMDPDQVQLVLGGRVLGPTLTLEEAGITRDTLLVVALLPSSAAKNFTLVVRTQGAYGGWVTHDFPESVDSVQALDKLTEACGGGSLVLASELDSGQTAVAVQHPDQIKEGETYVLFGGMEEAVRRNYIRRRASTQVTDKVKAEEALAAVMADPAFGDLEEFKDYDTSTSENKVLVNKHGHTRQFDSIAVSGTQAVVLELQYRAEMEHVTLVMVKAKHLQAIAAEGRIPRLAGIKTVIPVLAAKRISPGLQRFCDELAVGVVAPNGQGLSFIYKPTVGPNASPSSVGTSN